MPSYLAPNRTIAFSRQSGRCYYCGFPMWSGNPGELVLKYGITHDQAEQLQCTGEHLEARKDGGNASEKNIVAACLTCNLRRHSREKGAPPDRYKELVLSQLGQGRWHPICVVKRLAPELYRN